MPNQKERTVPHFQTAHICNAACSPDQLLWAACLQSCVISLIAKKQLVWELQKYGVDGTRERHKRDKRHHRMQTDAMQDLAWINSDSREIGSFLWVCHVLNLDAGRIYKKIMREIKYAWKGPTRREIKGLGFRHKWNRAA